METLTCTVRQAEPNKSVGLFLGLDCLGEVDRNRTVDALDLACVKDPYGQTGASGPFAGDANHDGNVNDLHKDLVFEILGSCDGSRTDLTGCSYPILVSGANAHRLGMLGAEPRDPGHAVRT